MGDPKSGRREDMDLEKLPENYLNTNPEERSTGYNLFFVVS